MSRALSKVSVMTLMLIAFVGQALAYSTMSCEMYSGPHESHMNMDHSKMSHDGMNQSSDDQAEDCCDVECVCPANACSSTAVLISSIGSTDIQILNESVAALQSKQPHSISTSLYRPPIFA